MDPPVSKENNTRNWSLNISKILTENVCSDSMEDHCVSKSLVTYFDFSFTFKKKSRSIEFILGPVWFACFHSCSMNKGRGEFSHSCRLFRLVLVYQESSQNHPSYPRVMDYPGIILQVRSCSLQIMEAGAWSIGLGIEVLKLPSFESPGVEDWDSGETELYNTQSPAKILKNHNIAKR